ncbi:PaaI family thioesterase [Notoacmeibacter sp. MSK16QG-6]|uniref:PaaI family thioesterase n=1 Tax=Notoacmeibacter sp. MSK16QG-6 TaxID=2957982 RepID=UPI00209CFA84|nr:PaaI family thioesterase [Notoacmeibacter sp. MSK16QG-6]MCP1198432.1 PaaI family thioesterase [Notoacmeibacter sp. MSK16QG-6]
MATTDGNLSPILGKDEVQRIMADGFGEYHDDFPYEVLAVEPGEVRIRFNAEKRHLRPGGTISGPALFTLADIGGWACALSHVRGDPLIVTTNVNINFMRKAEAGPVDAICRILKMGRTLLVFEVEMISQGRCAAHATGTYAIPAVEQD